MPRKARLDAPGTLMTVKILLSALVIWQKRQIPPFMPGLC
jgi:hypothetical protein